MKRRLRRLLEDVEGLMLLVIFVTVVVYAVGVLAMLAYLASGSETAACYVIAVCIFLAAYPKTREKALSALFTFGCVAVAAVSVYSILFGGYFDKIAGGLSLIGVIYAYRELMG